MTCGAFLLFMQIKNETSMKENRSDNDIRLKISPVKIGELVKVPLSKIKSGKQPSVEKWA